MPLDSSGSLSGCHLWYIFFLFAFSFLISPSLNLIRGTKFKKLQEKLVSLSSKKLGTNLFLIPLLLSQIILYPYLPNASHYTYDILFFVFGLCVFSNNRIILSLMNQRRYYLGESLVLSIIMLSPNFINYEGISHEVTYFSSVMLALSCSMTVLGYARKYLNFNSKFRKLANEAIYPFYLLQQPIIVVIAYYIVQFDTSAGIKLIAITLSSFIISVGVYWYLVRPINVFRVIFGLKPNFPKGTPYIEIALRRIQAIIDFNRIKILKKRMQNKQKYSLKLTHQASIQKLLLELVS